MKKKKKWKWKVKRCPSPLLRRCDDCQRLKTTLQLIIITAFWQKKAARSLSDIAWLVMSHFLFLPSIFFFFFFFFCCRCCCCFASLPLFDRSDLRSYHLLLSTTSLVALAVRITSLSKEGEIYRNNDEWRQKAYKPANNNCLSLSVIRKVPRLPEKQLLLVLFAYYYYYNTDLYSSD